MKYVALFILCLLTHNLTSSVLDTGTERLIIEQFEERLEQERLERERQERIERDGYDILVYNAKMAELESSNRYDVINRLGYMGKYQFGKTTLRELRKLHVLDFRNSEIRWKNFKKNHQLQEEAMEALTKHNLKVLDNYGLRVFVGSEINGIRITIEGLLAASHLRGPNAVRLYLRSQGEINLTDANGTGVEKYINEFANAVV